MYFEIFLLHGLYFQNISVFLRSFISGISLLGTPTEIYVYGVQYMYIVGGVISMGFIMMYIYLPVFHNLQLTSTYQVHCYISNVSIDPK